MDVTHLTDPGLSHRITCLCDREWIGDDEGALWASLQSHVEEMAGVDDSLHGLKESGLTRVVEVASLTPQEVVATHGADIGRQLEIRLDEGSDWTTDQELELRLHVIEYLAMSNHIRHDSRGIDWRECASTSCHYAQLISQEIDE